MPEHDVLVRGGTLIDGTGAPPRTGDVAISDGRITAVGEVDGTAGRTIDADGALVAPGFVDIHTHYDGQVTWDDTVTPSSWHGITTVVMGNCGVGFAPVRPTDHQRLIELMEGVEDIPGAALHEGLTWEWETFPEYLDAVERRAHDIDVAAQVPHGAVRLFVMGERGANREAANADEIARMGEIVREAVEAGALGFTTSRTLNHRTSRGEPTPTLTAAEAELVGIAEAMGKSGAGVVELVSDFGDVDREFGHFRRMVEASGRPMSISVAQVDRYGWRNLLDRIDQAAADGLPMRGQVASRPIGLILGLQATVNPLLGCGAYREIHQLPLDERVRVMSDPDFKARVLDEMDERRSGGRTSGFFGGFEKMFPLGDPPDYEPAPETSVAALAAKQGKRPQELAYDLLLEDNGCAFLYFPLFNYADFDLEAVREMLLHERTVPGLADGGAHVGTICDASFATTLLTHWCRDRSRGERLDLAWAIKRQTRDTAEAVGLLDRGLLVEGAKADVNVIDFERLTLRRPEMVFDLPAGGKRLVQRAEGYLATLVNGEVTYENGQHTGALPGRLVRGHQPEVGRTPPQAVAQ
jgi:N-acyl-D-aspartate/D-glutamate deacylase